MLLVSMSMFECVDNNLDKSFSCTHLHLKLVVHFSFGVLQYNGILLSQSSSSLKTFKKIPRMLIILIKFYFSLTNVNVVPSAYWDRIYDLFSFRRLNFLTSLISTTCFTIAFRTLPTSKRKKDMEQVGTLASPHIEFWMLQLLNHWEMLSHLPLEKVP